MDVPGLVATGRGYGVNQVSLRNPVGVRQEHTSDRIATHPFSTVLILHRAAGCLMPGRGGI